MTAGGQCPISITHQHGLQVRRDGIPGLAQGVSETYQNEAQLSSSVMSDLRQYDKVPFSWQASPHRMQYKRDNKRKIVIDFAGSCDLPTTAGDPACAPGEISGNTFELFWYLKPTENPALN